MLLSTDFISSLLSATLSTKLSFLKKLCTFEALLLLIILIKSEVRLYFMPKLFKTINYFFPTITAALPFFHSQHQNMMHLLT